MRVIYSILIISFINKTAEESLKRIMPNLEETNNPCFLGQKDAIINFLSLVWNLKILDFAILGQPKKSKNMKLMKIQTYN